MASPILTASHLQNEEAAFAYLEARCQPAWNGDPLSASKRDPFRCDLCR